MAHPEAMGPNVGPSTPGRRRMDASRSEFAARMASKPMPESLNSDPDYRIFFDPPEIVQIAFGGRPWFVETGCRAVHRIGLFKGLGWELDPVFASTAPKGITGVRVTLAPNNTYTIEFVQRAVPEDHMHGTSCKIVEARVGLRPDQLKQTYAEVIGEYVT